MNRKAITLLSSGLDSTVATRMSMENCDVVLALTFDYGQIAAKKEIECASSLCEQWKIEHEVIALPWLKKETKTSLVDSSHDLPEPGREKLDADADANAAKVWVPNRNGVIISIAAAYAEARSIDLIIAGLNAEEANSFPDNSEEFIDRTNEALKFSTLKYISLSSPTIGMNKKQIAEKIIEYGIPVDTFWCCYRGGERLCGRCESCLRTKIAFEDTKAWNDLKKRFEA